MDLTPEPPFERGEMLTAERVEAVLLAAAQDALTASPDWTGGFRVPVSRWLTGLSETIEHGAAATDEHHGALALANLILRGPYRAGREDAAQEIEAEAREHADSIDEEGIGWEGGLRLAVAIARGEAISLGRSVQGDGDNPEEQGPPSKDQGRSEPSWSRVCGPHCIDGYCCDHAEEQRP